MKLSPTETVLTVLTETSRLSMAQMTARLSKDAAPTVRKAMKLGYVIRDGLNYSITNKGRERLRTGKFNRGPTAIVLKALAEGPKTGPDLADLICGCSAEVGIITHRQSVKGNMTRVDGNSRNQTATWALTDLGKERVEQMLTHEGIWGEVVG